jgi:hypothetical protein
MAEDDPLVALIRDAREQQLLFLRTVRDAAMLAGEQVQDMRNALLQDPPGVSATSFLVDVLLTIAMGPVASALISGGVKRGVRWILRDRSASSRSGLITVEERPSLLTPVTDRSIGLAQQTFNGKSTFDPKDLMNVRSTASRLWREYAVKLAESTAAAKSGQAVIGAVSSATKKLIPPAGTAGRIPAGTTGGGDTATVAVRRAALAFVRLQEAAVVRIHEHYVEQATKATLTFTPEVFRKFLEDNVAFERRHELNEEMEKRLSFFFEACIWLMHFGSAATIGTASRERQVGAGIWGTKWVERFASRRLVDYLARRFPHPADRTGTQSFFEYHVNRTGTPVGGWPPAGTKPPAGYQPRVQRAALGTRDTPGGIPAREGSLSIGEEARRDLLSWLRELESDMTKAIPPELRDLGFQVLGPTKLKP